MPRANRYFTPGQIWHITHRYHKREFLLKFPKDRQRWLGWLFEARKRFGLSILDWIDEGLAKTNPFRDDWWTESLAVGGEAFVKEIWEALGVRAIGRSIIEDGEQQQLRDLQQPYNALFDLEKSCLSQNIGWNGTFIVLFKVLVWSDPNLPAP